MKPSISVVIPVYKCNDCIAELSARITKTLQPISKRYEIIFVNDGSPDNSWKTIKHIASKDPHIIGISLSRNFGQHHAITAGIDASSGDWVVVMDGDLQDQPEFIKNLFEKTKKGFDIVYARRIARLDGMAKIVTSWMFRFVFEALTGIELNPSIGNFSIASRQVIDSIKPMKEQNRWYLQNLKWAGFTETSVEVTHAKRYAGNTSYTWSSLFSFALDNIVAYSNKPLKIAVFLGLFFATSSFLYALFMIWRWFFWRVPLLGYTSIIVSLYFLSGLIIANLGILGLYIGRIFDETKHRPLYIIKEKIHGGNSL